MSNPGKTPSKRGSRPKGPGRGQAKTKIVVRRLPANLPEHVFAESIKPLVPETVMDRPLTWVAGKVSKNPVKGNTFARAYIYFKAEKLALDFQKAYHGHVFMDKHGNEGRAHVEFAPFQKIPREQRKADPKQGTIEEDPEYIAFLQSMNAEPTEADKEMKLSGTELLLKESAVNPKSTPLLEALRAQKAAAQAKAQAAKLAARQARQAGKGGLSNSSKAQITILANRNATNKPGGGSSNRASGSNKPQQNQAQGGQQGGSQGQGKKPASDENAANAKPKRERKRRDRAGKRAAEAQGAPSSGDTAQPQITLLKPQKPSIMAKPESAPVQAQETRRNASDTPTPPKNEVNAGGEGGRSGRSRRNRGERNKEPKPANNKPGEGGSVPNQASGNKAPNPPGSGTSTRSGRNRRRGGDAPANSAQG